MPALQSPGRHEENATPAEARMNCSNFASCWRRERDSNPRYRFRYTHFPGVRLQPLGHPSRTDRGPTRALGAGGGLLRQVRVCSRGVGVWQGEECHRRTRCAPPGSGPGGVGVQAMRRGRSAGAACVADDGPVGPLTGAGVGGTEGVPAPVWRNPGVDGAGLSVVTGAGTGVVGIATGAAGSAEAGTGASSSSGPARISGGVFHTKASRRPETGETGAQRSEMMPSATQAGR